VAVHGEHGTVHLHASIMDLIVQCDDLAACSPVMVRVIVGRVDAEPSRIDASQVALVQIDVLLQC